MLEKYELEGINEDFFNLKQFIVSQREDIDVREEIVFLHEQISLKIFKIRKQIDKEMSKFYNGTIPWSPELQGYRDQIDYWHWILHTKTNVATSKTIIKRLSLC